MPWQLVYTSAPCGLVPGRSGFCTVTRDREMRERLAQELERVSACESTALPEGQPLFTFRRVLLGLDAFGVITRACRAGIDYTQRANMLAHHLVFTAQEMAFLGDSITPAEIALLWPKWLERWEGQPRFIELSEKIQLQEIRTLRQRFPLPARTWQTMSGDAGNAAFMAGNESVFFSGDTLPCETILKLWSEGASLLPSPEIWRTEWATHWIPNDFSPRWAAHLHPRAKTENACVIDPLRPPPLPADLVQLATAARTGKLPEAPKPVDAAAAESARPRAALEAAIAPETARAWILPVACLTLALVCAALLWVWLAPSRETPCALPPPPPNSNLPPLDLRAERRIESQPAKISAPASASKDHIEQTPVPVLVAPATTPAPQKSADPRASSPADAPPARRINSLPEVPTLLLADGWQTAIVCDDFVQRSVSFAVPAFLRDLFGETPPNVFAAPANSPFPQADFIPLPIRAQEDYERGYSLVVRDFTRSPQIGFLFQLDFPDAGTVRLTRRAFPENSPLLRAAANSPVLALQGNVALRFQKDDRACVMLLIDRLDNWRALKLPLNFAGRPSVFADKGGKSVFAPEVAEGLDRLVLPGAVLFELSDAQGLFHAQAAHASALAFDRRAMSTNLSVRLSRLSGELAQLGPDAAAPRAPIEKEIARLSDLKARLEAPDWPARLAPWTWRALEKSGGQNALELVKFITPQSSPHER